MNRKAVGRLFEYVGYLVVIVVLFQIKPVAAELAVGALVAYFGIQMRTDKSGAS